MNVNEYANFEGEKTLALLPLEAFGVDLTRIRAVVLSGFVGEQIPYTIHSIEFVQTCGQPCTQVVIDDFSCRGRFFLNTNLLG